MVEGSIIMISQSSLAEEPLANFAQKECAVFSFQLLIEPIAPAIRSISRLCTEGVCSVLLFLLIGVHSWPFLSSIS